MTLGSNQLSNLRAQINDIDDKMVALAQERLNLSREIALCKKREDIPIVDLSREQEHMKAVLDKTPSDLHAFIEPVWRALMDSSKAYQQVIVGQGCFGLIGEKLGHSYSPEIHHLMAPYDYQLYEMKQSDLFRDLERLNLDGFNVTIPYKETIMSLCGELDQRALRIGSVNTVVKTKDGQYKGYNTDYTGFDSLLKRNNIFPQGKDVVILGTGGASKAVVEVMLDRGASSVTLVSRNPQHHHAKDNRVSYAGYTSNVIGKAQILVNATPVGMYPHISEAPVTISSDFLTETLIDLIYNPGQTVLMQQALKLGIQAIGGLEMLVVQAYEAARLFGYGSYLKYSVDELVMAVESRMRNIVLIGMPGSGKSSVALSLSELLNRTYIDFDSLLEKDFKQPLFNVFEKGDEDVFRSKETALCSYYGSQSGLVIATGGGVVTRSENFHLLKRNSLIIYLRRPLKELEITGRYVSQTVGVKELYQKRSALYEAWNDVVIENNESVEKTVNSIVNLLGRVD